MKYLGGKIFLILSFILISGFFIGQKCFAAAEVIINEAAWMGTLSSANDEWLELANKGSEEMIIEGWILAFGTSTPKKIENCKIKQPCAIPAGGFFLLERTDDTSAPPGADLIYTGALNDSGEILTLKDESGAVIDYLDASAKWPAGDKEKKLTMERATNHSWCSSLAAGGTPKMFNDCLAEIPPAPPVIPENKNGNGGGSPASFFDFGDIIINEFLSDPAAGENEWIEFYNKTGATFYLDDWFVSDGAGAKTFLSGTADSEKRFFILEKPKGALNNAGDEISLFAPDGELIDRAIYGDYGSSTENNIPAPAKGFSAALKKDGEKSGTLKNSFAITGEPTPGKPNIIIEAEESKAESAPEAESGTVLITEIFPNPFGSDRESEYLELYNSSDKEINLIGWRIEIENGRSFVFGEFFNPTAILKSREYYVLWRKDSNIALDNNGGTIRLFSPSSARAKQLIEYGAALENLSFSDTKNISAAAASSTKIFLANTLEIERWVWSLWPTPGRANEIKIANRPPQIKFSFAENIAPGAPAVFDASDSVDEDGNPIYFTWDFGDGAILSGETPAHSFLKNGEYKIKLIGSDGQAETVLEKIVRVGAPFSAALEKKISSAPIDLNKEKALFGAANNAPLSFGKDVKISALLPEAEDVFSARGAASLKDEKPGALVKIYGTVLAEPGIFGAQYFYIINEGAAAVKIYNFKKDFPALARGDLIEASGQVMQNENEKYLKISSQADVKILGRGELPLPEEKESIAAADFGKFIALFGELGKKDGARQEFKTASGTASLYFKSGAKIDKSLLKSGQKAKIAGLVGVITKGLELLPRGMEDINILSLENNSASAVNNESAGEAKGVSTGSQEWILPARENDSDFSRYLLVIFGAAILVLSGLFFLKKKNP